MESRFDCLLEDLPIGSQFKLDLASQYEYSVIDPMLGLVSEISTGCIRQFPPYWWVYIFYS